MPPSWTSWHTVYPTWGLVVKSTGGINQRRRRTPRPRQGRDSVRPVCWPERGCPGVLAAHVAVCSEV